MAGRFNCVQVIYYYFHNALESLILYKRGLVISVELLRKIVVNNFNLTVYVFVVVILLSIHQSHLNLMARKKIDYSYKRISIESIKTILIFLFHNQQAKHFLLHFLTANDICLPVYGCRRNFSMHVIRSLLMCNILYHQCGLSNSIY